MAWMTAGGVHGSEVVLVDLLRRVAIWILCQVFDLAAAAQSLFIGHQGCIPNQIPDVSGYGTPVLLKFLANRGGHLRSLRPHSPNRCDSDRCKNCFDRAPIIRPGQAPLFGSRPPRDRVDPASRQSR